MHPARGGPTKPEGTPAQPRPSPSQVDRRALPRIRPSRPGRMWLRGPATRGPTRSGGPAPATEPECALAPPTGRRRRESRHQSPQAHEVPALRPRRRAGRAQGHRGPCPRPALPAVSVDLPSATPGIVSTNKRARLPLSEGRRTSAWGLLSGSCGWFPRATGRTLRSTLPTMPGQSSPVPPPWDFTRPCRRYRPTRRSRPCPTMSPTPRPPAPIRLTHLCLRPCAARLRSMRSRAQLGRALRPSNRRPRSQGHPKAPVVACLRR